jgi:hypothetical protein
MYLTDKQTNTLLRSFFSKGPSKLSVAFPAIDVATTLWEPSLRGRRGGGSAFGHLPFKITSVHFVDYAVRQRSTLPPFSCARFQTPLCSHSLVSVAYKALLVEPRAHYMYLLQH